MKKCLLCKNKIKKGNYKYCYRHDLGAFTGRDRTREIVRMRDKHTCQKCGLKWKTWMRRLDVHHLKDKNGSMTMSYDNFKSLKDLRWMITLCHRCHLRIDSHKMKVGRKSGKKVIYGTHEGKVINMSQRLSLNEKI